MKKFIALSVVLFSFSANAAPPVFPADITLSWNWPTEYVLVPGDPAAEPILDGELVSARLTCTRQSGEVTFETSVPIGAGVLPGQRQSQLFAGDIPKPGTYTCLSFATTINGAESDASNAAVKKYLGVPNANSNLAAQ